MPSHGLHRGRVGQSPQASAFRLPTTRNLHLVSSRPAARFRTCSNSTGALPFIPMLSRSICRCITSPRKARKVPEVDGRWKRMSVEHAFAWPAQGQSWTKSNSVGRSFPIHFDSFSQHPCIWIHFALGALTLTVPHAAKERSRHVSAFRAFSRQALGPALGSIMLCCAMLRYIVSEASIV